MFLKDKSIYVYIQIAWHLFHLDFCTYILVELELHSFMPIKYFNNDPHV